MRTQVDPAPESARPVTHASPEPREGSPAGSVRVAVPSVFTRAAVAQLQAMAGNRATTRALARNGATAQALRSGPVVQRALASGQAAALAARLHDAMAGWGTDEDAVYGALTSRTPEDIDAIKDAYFFAYNHTLLEDINDEFSGDELAKVMRLLEGRPAPGATATPAQTAAAAVSRAGEIAQQLVDAMRGLGTEEDQIFNALEGRTPEEIEEIRRQYFALTGHSLDRDIRDEMSGDDLRRAMSYLHSEASGSFRNEFTEFLTEDYRGGGSGIWEWEIASGRFLVHVGVRFEPDPGITPPISLWQSQIRDIWNRFVLTANGGNSAGGSEYPIVFDLQDQRSAERSVRVQQNANGTSYAPPDRAYSNLWYPDMRPTIAPHEFGHLVGLADEYERTLEDYRTVTGQNLPEPGAATAADQQVATQLHDALRLADVSQRASGATTALETAGLISGGAAVQGSQAQRVMQAYNAAYATADGENLLHAIRYRCAPDSYWTLISVFSFTSSSIMGNESDHTHPVEPRHLRFVLDIIRRRYPRATWGLRATR